MAQKEENGGSGIAIGIFALLLLSLSWLSIPSASEITGMHIASFSFIDGILVGWADEAYVWLFHSEEPEMARIVTKAFRGAALLGEEEHPITVLIFLLLGTIFSIGGVIAVWVARNADNLNHAFALGFWAEIVEAGAYHTGYYHTMQKSALSFEEVGITVVVAIVMGLVAQSVWKKYHKQKGEVKA